jgi:hypothetical protein
LGWITIVHATLLSFLVLWMVRYGSTSFIQERLWVGLATLWVFWPIVLVLHAGRSVLRVGIPLLVSILILFPSIREYPRMALYTLGVAPFVDLSPRSIMDYLVAHRVGRADATKDIQSGRLVIETYGLPPPPQYPEILRQRYHVELRPIAGCTDVTPKVIGHEQGYNGVSKAEIKRRFGSNVLEAVREETLKRLKEGSAR